MLMPEHTSIAMIQSMPSLRDLAAQQVPVVEPSDLHWRRRWLGYADYWRWQLGGWTMVAVSQLSLAFVMPAGLQGRLEMLLMFTMAVAGMTFTHLLRGVIIGLRSRHLTWKGLLIRLVPWIIGFACVWGTALAWLGTSVIGDDFFIGPHRSSVELLPASRRFAYCAFGIANGAFVVQSVWIACYFMHHLFAAYQHSQMERLRLEASNREAEVRHLRSQMDPHFLFNSLNTVRALIAAENTEARGALTHLSDLLRNSLRQGDKALIPLKDELAALDSHLAIEQLRFGSRLRIRRRVSPQLGDCPVPPFLVQTLVENAIKHGVAKREQGGDIVVTIAKKRECLCCIVRNTGVLHQTGEGGLGLRNIRVRLQHLYQGQATFILHQRGPAQVRAVVRLPLQAAF